MTAVVIFSEFALLTLLTNVANLHSKTNVVRNWFSLSIARESPMNLNSKKNCSYIKQAEGKNLHL